MSDTICSARRSLANAMTPRHPNPVMEREQAWAANPRCLVCATPTPSANRSAVLPTPEGSRVTCLSPCFAIAVARINPTFSTAAALRRAEA